MFSGMFSGIGSAIIGGAAGLFGGHSANKQAAASAQASMRFQERTMKNRYQWMYDDLAKAGINPMLAYAKQSSGAQGAQYQPRNVGEEAVKGATSARQTSLMAREQDNRDMVARTQALQNSAKASEARAKAQESRSKVTSDLYGKQAGMYGQSAEQSKAQVGVIEMQKWQVNKDIARKQAEIDRMRQQIKESKTSAARNRAQARLAQKQGELAQARKREHEVDALMKELGVPKKRIESRHYRSKFAEKFGDYIRMPARELKDVILPYRKR